MNIIIFGADGNSIPIVDGIGVLNLPTCSVGLVENTTIYLMEKVIVGSDIKLSQIDNISEMILDVSGDGYHISTVDRSGEIPLLLKSLNTIIPSKTVTPTYDVDGYRNNGLVTPVPYQINVSLISDVDGIKNGSLRIFHGNTLLLTLTLYSELVEEDSRYVDILSNMGESISHFHELIFKDSDINEELPNKILLNSKRKEYLTEIRNISPYLSAVEGIERIIDFFDYANVLTVKEYWYNKFTEKITVLPVDEINKDMNLEKLAQYGLFYKINEPTDVNDEDGLPILKQNFLFSNDEVAIKLFALKEYFISKDIGGVSDITDIVGEVYMFNGFNIRHWKSNVETLVYDNIPNSYFTTSGDCYIDPIRQYSNNVISPYYTFGELGIRKLEEIKDHQISYFSGYLDDKPTMLDDPERKVGGTIKLVNKTFLNTWKDNHSDWNTIGTWKNIGNLNYYKVTWEIERSSGDTMIDGRTHHQILTGDINDLAEVEFIVPYEGHYDITLTNTAYDGIESKAKSLKKVLVSKRDMNFVFIHKLTDDRLKFWNKTDITWLESNQEWNENKYDNREYHTENHHVHINKFKLARLKTKTNVIKNQTWKESRLPWSDKSFTSWSDTKFTDHKHPQFFILSLGENSVFVVNDVIYKIPNHINRLNMYDVCVFLNANAYDEFEFIPRKLGNVGYIEAQRIWHSDKKLFYISHNNNMVIKSFDDFIAPKQNMVDFLIKNKLIFDVNLSDPNIDVNGIVIDMNLPSIQHSNESRWTYKHTTASHRDDPYTMDNSRVDSNKLDIPIGVPFFMSVDNSNIAGKKTIHWVITNYLDEVVFDETGEVVGFEPNDVGLYSVTVTITDNENNIYNLKKNNIIKVFSSNEFKLLNNGK